MEAINDHAKSVAIILVNWNGLEHTSKCIASLKEVTYANVQIIVVDNGSNEAEVMSLREIQGIILIENEKNLGFTGGNNVGIKYAYEEGFDLIMLLNNDTTVDSGFVEPLIAGFGGSVGAVQPKISSMADPNQIWNAGGTMNRYIGLPITIGAGEKDTGQFDEIREIDWITGCCLLFSREMVEKVGYLDNTYFILFEDADWSIRARKAGFKLLYLPQSRIYHFESATAVSRKKGKEGYRSARRQYINIRNHLFLVRKHVPLIFMPFAVVHQSIKISKYLAYYIIRGRWGKFKATIRGVRDGLGKFKEIDFGS